MGERAITIEIADDDIKKLAELARLPATADLDCFGKDVCATLKRYCEAAKEARPHEVRNEITALWKLARRVERGETSLKGRLAEMYDALSPESRGFLHQPLERLGRRAGPIPSASELSDTKTAQEAAARLRSLLQQGATSEPWDLELSNLADYAERVAFGSAIRARQIGNAPSEELRERWQEGAAELSATERATLVARLSRLSPPAKKRLRAWAAHQSFQIPAPELLASPITAIEGARRLLSILARGKNLRRRLKPLLRAPNVARGRPVQEAARELVMFLAIDYESATGHRPARTANPRAPGPFVRLVTEALRLAGTPHVDAVELVSWYGSLRPREKRRPTAP